MKPESQLESILAPDFDRSTLGLYVRIGNASNADRLGL
jgi:hypothetical protein